MTTQKNEKMKWKINWASVLIFILCMALVLSILFYGLNPLKKTIDYCEDKGWNGEEYNTGVRTTNIFRENYDIKVKCSKAEETDAIIGILDALYFWRD